MGDTLKNGGDLATVFSDTCKKMALADAKIEPHSVNAMRPFLSIIHRLEDSGFPARLMQFERTRDGGYVLSLSTDCLQENGKPISFVHDIHLFSQDSAGKTVLASLDSPKGLPFFGGGTWTNIADPNNQENFAKKIVELTALKYNLYKKAQKAETALSAAM